MLIRQKVLLDKVLIEEYILFSKALGLVLHTLILKKKFGKKKSKCIPKKVF